MDDLDKTIAPRRERIQIESDETIPNRRVRKPDGRFVIGELILDRYKVLALLGKGAMGVVYKCFDEVAGIEVALKTLPPELSDNTLEMEAFKNNFQLIHNLHHPNIVNLNQLVQDPQTRGYYLIMEYIQGVKLTEYMQNNCSRDQKKNILLQAAETLDFVHKQKFIHQDIKPDNIMITVDGTVKILDFGIAAKLEDRTRMSTDEAFCGSLPYIAPELWGEDKTVELSSAADRYAFAVIAFEWNCGYHPFYDESPDKFKQNIIDGNIKFPAMINFREKKVLKKALSLNPSERYSSCRDFVKSFFERPFYQSYKFMSLAGGLIVICLAAVLTTLLFSKNDTEPPPPGPPVLIPVNGAPRLLIRSNENIRNLKTENLSQGLLQELALDYGFKTVNPGYVKDKRSYDFVIDVQFNGAYHQSKIYNMSYHDFSLSADMNATYPNGELIAQVTLPSKSRSFSIKMTADPNEALRKFVYDRISSGNEKSFRNLLLRVHEKLTQKVEREKKVAIILKNSEDIIDDIKSGVLEIMKEKQLLSDYTVHSESDDGSVTIEIFSKVQCESVASLFVILSEKNLKINSVEDKQIILERKTND